jgi:hypothetical protein
MHAHETRRAPQDRISAGRSSRPAAAASIPLLALQRTAGNAAVTRAIEEQRHEGAGPGHDQPAQRSTAPHPRHSPGRSPDVPLQRAPATQPPPAAPVAGPVRISHPQIKLLTPKPRMLYRGDSRSPAQIKSTGGFVSQGMNYDQMVRHLLGLIRDGDESGWISVTSRESVAQTFAAPPSRATVKPGRPLSFFPPSKGTEPTAVSTGWVYEIRSTGNMVSFDDQAQGEREKRQTEWTKEWGAIRKINMANIARAVRYEAVYKSDVHGAVSNNLSIEAKETWENPDYEENDHGYNPYTHPGSGWHDNVNVTDRSSLRAAPGA